MTYEQFLDSISTRVRAMLPASYDVKLRKVVKNNNQTFDGLVISEENACASPTIYLNTYYSDHYLNGSSVETICEHILTQYENARLTEPIDTSFFADFSNLKDHIIFQIVNHDMNRDLLPEIPHFDYLDLSITFLILLSVQKTADATILIRNSHLKLWGVDKDALFTLAKRNTPRLLTWNMKHLHDILSALEPPDNDQIPAPDDLAAPMYVLTNRFRLHGAGCILYDNLLSSLSKEMDDDFYIIPSSIHEVLLIPQTFAHDRNELDHMICEVNRVQVPGEEVLSNHAYFYSREKNEIVF